MPKPKRAEFLSAAACARRTGLTVRALRVYERSGLLAPTRSGRGVAALRSEGAAVPERHRDSQDPRYVLGGDPLAAEKQTAAARARTRDATHGMPGQARWRAAGSRARSGGARDDRVRTDADPGRTLQSHEEQHGDGQSSGPHP